MAGEAGATPEAKHRGRCCPNQQGTKSRAQIAEAALHCADATRGGRYRGMGGMLRAGEVRQTTANPPLHHARNCCNLFLMIRTPPPEPSAHKLRCLQFLMFVPPAAPPPPVYNPPPRTTPHPRSPPLPLISGLIVAFVLEI